LTRIDYLRDPDPTESVLMEYDPNGNLTRLTERNGDRLSMSYDKLNRLKDTARASVTGPRWTLANGFDSRGNRTSLKTNLPVYGSAEYGGAEYGTGITTVFSAHYNTLNQMDSLTDSADNTTEFAFDVDGRMAGVNHPPEDLQTRYRYDLVGVVRRVLRDLIVFCGIPSAGARGAVPGDSCDAPLVAWASVASCVM